MIYVTSGTAQTIATGANGLLVTVNTALTGTITLKAGTTTFAIITNPTAGKSFRYNGLRGQGAISITPSDVCDCTVSFLNREV